MDQIPMKRISIQVSLSGYSFRIYEAGELVSCSGWIPSGGVESASELTGTYDQVLLSVMTPKITLVPDTFFDPQTAGELLSRTVELAPSDKIGRILLEEYSSWLVFPLDG